MGRQKLIEIIKYRPYCQSQPLRKASNLFPPEMSGHRLDKHGGNSYDAFSGGTKLEFRHGTACSGCCFSKPYHANAGIVVYVKVGHGIFFPRLSKSIVPYFLWCKLTPLIGSLHWVTEFIKYVELHKKSFFLLKLRQTFNDSIIQ